MKKVKKIKKPTRKSLKNKCDRLWAALGKENADCEVCKTVERVNYTQLHPHHYIGRKNMALRWDLRNRIWLCPTHHSLGNLSAHNDPKWFQDWMVENRNKDWEYCNQIKNQLAVDIDYDLILSKLEEKEDDNE